MIARADPISPGWSRTRRGMGQGRAGRTAEARKQGQEWAWVEEFTSVHHGGDSYLFHCPLQAPHPALGLAPSSLKLQARLTISHRR